MNNPKYKKNDFFVYSDRIGKENRLIFYVEDVKWSNNAKDWMYTVFYPYEGCFRNYSEKRLDTDCIFIQDGINKQKMLKALYGYKKGA